MASASTTKTGTLVGTPLFMSPEQIRGASQVDHRADLYSLGMVFYNMVTGIHAFNGPSYSDVLVAICTEPLPDIREKAPWLPETVGEWFSKACARDVVDRFQSADEMIESLRDAAGPHSRLNRASLPEDVSGPSGTIMGHVPPHVMNTVNLKDVGIDLARPATDETLRSRTSGVPGGAEPHEPSGSVATVRPRRATVGYALLAIAGAGFALVLVIGSLLLRWVYRLVTDDVSRPPPAMVTAESAPIAVPQPHVSAPPAVVDPPSPPATEPPPTEAETPVEVSNENPRRAPTSTRRSAGPTARVPGAPATPASASPVTPPRQGPPDMGF
jgi:serine/threonine-protein kinase